VILLPYLGVFIYLIARGDKMQEHAIVQAQAAEAAQQAYIRSVVQNDPNAWSRPHIKRGSRPTMSRCPGRSTG
jgi:hypothetical protein